MKLYFNFAVFLTLQLCVLQSLVSIGICQGISADAFQPTLLYFSVHCFSLICELINKGQGACVGGSHFLYMLSSVIQQIYQILHTG